MCLSQTFGLFWLLFCFNVYLSASNFVEPCSIDPCDCNNEEEDPHCMICHSNGCNQCEDGYFKKDYNYPCVECQETFGDECMFCQDFNGCGQCKSNFNRVKDSVSGLYYCTLNEDINGDSITVLLDDLATFDGYLDLIPSDLNSDSPSDINININGIDSETEDSVPLYDPPSVESILQASKVIDVFADGTQYETTYSYNFLSDLIDNWYSQDLVSTTLNDENIDETDIISCDCDTICDEATRRRMAILGTDNRRQVTGTPIGTSSAWTGYLGWDVSFQYIGRTFNFHFHCTAALIGPKHIMTAGHCVHGGEFSTWFVPLNDMTFYPGLTKDHDPDDTFSITACRTWQSYVLNGLLMWDFAICELDHETNVGWFPFKNAANAKLEGDTVYVKGYPGDKDSGSMWYTHGTVWDETYSEIRSLNYDTYGGMSGGPLYKITNGKAYIYGAHIGWVKESFFFNLYYNRATKINSIIFAQICEVIGKNYKNC